MADRLALVAVGPDGTAGQVLGGLALRDGVIVAEGDVAAGVLGTLRRRSRLRDPRLWADLLERGWSNGQFMLVRETTEPLAGEGSGARGLAGQDSKP